MPCCEWIVCLFFIYFFFLKKKNLFCFSLLTPVGGGIPHGVLPEMGPGGNVGRLTEHRPRWTGTHETVQSLPDTMQKCNIKAQADTEAREGARAAGIGLAEPVPVESKNKGGKRGSVSWAPGLAKDLVSKSVSDSVSNSPTDIVAAAHLDPVTAEAQDRAVETANGPQARQTRKFSANLETARPRRESTGEHCSQRRIKLKTSPSSSGSIKVSHPDSHNSMSTFPLSYTKAFKNLK